VDLENVTFRLDVCERRNKETHGEGDVRSMTELRRVIKKVEKFTRRAEMQEGRAVDNTT
jgi:hypothetical protein